MLTFYSWGSKKREKRKQNITYKTKTNTFGFVLQPSQKNKKHPTPDFCGLFPKIQNIFPVGRSLLRFLLQLRQGLQQPQQRLAPGIRHVTLMTRAGEGLTPESS